MVTRPLQSRLMATTLMTITALMLAMSSFAAPVSSYALPKDDPQDDSPNADFDIRSYGFAGGNSYVQVYGHAGRSLPSGNIVHAYVFHTDSGIWVADSHEAQHDTNENDAGLGWHGQQVSIGEDGCIDEVDGSKSTARVAGKRVTLLDTDATELIKVETMQLELLVKDPENPPPGTTCIARVAGMFDSIES